MLVKDVDGKHYVTRGRKAGLGDYLSYSVSHWAASSSRALEIHLKSPAALGAAAAAAEVARVAAAAVEDAVQEDQWCEVEFQVSNS